MMASILGFSHLTIAATIVPDFGCGLFLDSATPTSAVLEETNSSVIRVRWPPTCAPDLRNSPLKSRGWVFQELLLSKGGVTLLMINSTSIAGLFLFQKT